MLLLRCVVCGMATTGTEEAEAVGTKGRTVEDKPLELEGMIGPPAPARPHGTQPLSWLWVHIMVQYKEKAGSAS